MNEIKTFSTTFCGRPFSVEIGKYAFLSGGACMVRYGETVVMASATASSKPREGVDYFPLSVDYEEKLYAIGKIPGNWQRREGRPAETAVLASRVIDRPLRPLFPKDMRNDCSVVLTVMSVDPDCTPEITAMLGASIAISISDIPWNGPISGISAGYVNGQVVLNPTFEERAISEMEVTVASSANKVVMIESGAIRNRTQPHNRPRLNRTNHPKPGENFFNLVVNLCGRSPVAYLVIHCHCHLKRIGVADFVKGNKIGAELVPLVHILGQAKTANDFRRLNITG